MKIVPSKSIAFLIGVLVLLLTGQSLAAGFVLCVGENGRTAFEQAVGGKCAPAQPACPVEEKCACSACGHDHCDPCDDYSTSVDSLQSRSRADQDLASLLLPPVIADVPSATWSIFLPDPTASLSPLPPPYPYTALLALRTVVLLN